MLFDGFFIVTESVNRINSTPTLSNVDIGVLFPGSWELEYKSPGSLVQFRYWIYPGKYVDEFRDFPVLFICFQMQNAKFVSYGKIILGTILCFWDVEIFRQRISTKI